MLIARVNASAAANAALSGCTFLGSNPTGPSLNDFNTLHLGNVTVSRRFRAGNLVYRGRFNRCFTDPSDQKRPPAVQDALLLDQHRSGHQEPHRLVGF